MSSIPLEPGIYQILCTITQKYYIGSAKSLQRRWIDHRKLLRSGRHYNIHLQRAWVKYGEKSFVFAVLEITTADRLIEREQYWIDQKCACDDLYGFNIARVAGSAIGIVRSPETRAKLAHAMRNRSPEARANMAAAQRGKTLSAEHRAKLAEAIRRRDPDVQARFLDAPKGHIKSSETRAKISENNRNRSPELRKRIAERIREVKRNEPDEIKAKRHTPHSPETIEKLRKAARNRSPEYCDKMRELKRKENLSPETREKYRIKALEREARKRNK